MSQSTVAVASYFRGSQTWIAWIWMESKWKLQPEQSHSDQTSPQWLNCTQPNIIDETDFKSLHFYHSIANQHPVLNILTHVDTFTDICTGSPSSKIHVRSTVNSITLHTRGNFFIFLFVPFEMCRHPRLLLLCVVPFARSFHFIFYFPRRDFTAAAWILP